MAYVTIDPADFLSDGLFFEDDFVSMTDAHQWEQYRDRMVLVRGCNSALFPPWAFMYITGKLAHVAKSVRFGNEHENIVVCRRKG